MGKPAKFQAKAGQEGVLAAQSLTVLRINAIFSLSTGFGLTCNGCRGRVIGILNIAICDDEAVQRGEIQRMLSGYLEAHPSLEGKLWTYSEGKALLEQAGEMGGFDLYILDILMPEFSGIEIGRRLRALGDGGEIIYLTNSNDFAADSYDVRAFFYLLKPVEEEKLFRVLAGAVEKLLRKKNRSMVVNTMQGPRCVLFHKIRYTERIGRVIRFYCTDGVVDSTTIRVPFREAMAPLLEDRRFCLCGASFVVNFQYVTGVNGPIVILDDGQSMALPKAAASDFKKAWGGYWLDASNPFSKV